MNSLVRIDLLESVQTTPYVRRRLAEMQIDRICGDYSLVGEVRDSKTIGSYVALRFHLKSIYKEGVPLYVVDDYVTITPGSHENFQPAHSLKVLKTYRVPEDMVHSGVVFKEGEEIVVRHNEGKKFMQLALGELELDTALSQKLETFAQKELYSFCIAEPTGWYVVGVYAYDVATALSHLNPLAPCFLAKGLNVQGKVCTDELLGIKEAYTVLGNKTNFIEALRQVYSTGEVVRTDSRLFNAWIDMVGAPSPSSADWLPFCATLKEAYIERKVM